MPVVLIDELADLALEIGDGAERTAADGLAGNQPEPAFDLIEPGAVGGCEVQVKPPPARKPRLDLGVFVGAVVIDDQMYVQVRGHVGLDVSQEGQKLLMAMARFALGEHRPVGDVECGKQGGRAMADIVVSDALHVPEPHRQHRLGSVERLHLGFLIHAQHERMIRGIQVKPDDIAHLLDEEGVGRELETPGAMGLQPEEREVAVHGGLRQPGFGGQPLARTMGLALGFALELGVDEARDSLLARAPRATGFQLAVQPGDAAAAKARAPQRDGRAAHTIAPGHRAARLAVGHREDHLCATQQRRRQTLRARDRLQLCPIGWVHNQCFRLSSHRMLPVPRIRPWTVLDV